MGQQQLLLLVLATVIVGIATVVGINAYSQNNLKSNADQLANEAVRIASDLQAWVQKPELFGGPAAADQGDLSKATLAQIKYEVNASNEYITPAGKCTYDGTNVTVTCENDDLKNEVTVVINGLLSTDLVTTTKVGTAN